MEHRKLTKLSKYLSLILRHQPEVADIELDEQGWVDVEELLGKLEAKGKSIDKASLHFIVENNNKKRFAFSEDGLRIRANQGHSIQIDLGYQPSIPPAELYHGTATRFIDSIGKEGLQKRSRHHVHLSADLTTATSVGSRHGKVVILIVKAKEMQQAGYDFFISDNNVWLTDHIPVEYIEFP